MIEGSVLAWWCGLLMGDLGSTVDLGQASELSWVSDILIWGEEEGAISQLLAVLFITKLRGHGEEGVASLHVPVVCPSVLGLSPFLRPLAPRLWWVWVGPT